MYKKKKIRLAFGGSPMDIDSPMQALFDIIRNSEEANMEASNDSTVAGLRMLGKTMTSTGMSMAGKGLSQSGEMSGVGGFMQKNWGNISKGINMAQSFAYGGKVAEIEGQEVVEMPDGSIHQAKGPSHEQGGIDLMLPDGAEVFSKRIKIDGVTIADRKKKREKKAVTLEELLKANESDLIIRNSLDRTKKNNIKEEELDTNVQKVVGGILAPPVEAETKFAYGSPGPVGPNPDLLKLLIEGINGMQDNAYGGFGTDAIGKNGEIEEVILTPDLKPVKNNKMAGIIEKPLGTIDSSIPGSTPSLSQESKAFDLNSVLEGLDIGDIGNVVGMAGNVYSAFAPMKNTLKNRAGDTPNINAYKDFGIDGLKALEESEKYIGEMKDEAISDLELGRQGTINRNNNSARGINTLRALNLVTDSMFNNSKSDINNNASAQMMQLLGQKATLENQQDQMVMRGEEGRDLADRMDRDNFFTQMAEDISTKGRGIQQIGKDINQIKQNDVSMNLINQLSQYGITVDKRGNLSYKKPAEVKPGSKKVESKADTETYIDNGSYVIDGKTITAEEIKKALDNLQNKKYKKSK